MFRSKMGAQTSSEELLETEKTKNKFENKDKNVKKCNENKINKSGRSKNKKSVIGDEKTDSNDCLLNLNDTETAKNDAKSVENDSKLSENDSNNKKIGQKTSNYLESDIKLGESDKKQVTPSESLNLTVEESVLTVKPDLSTENSKLTPENSYLTDKADLIGGNLDLSAQYSGVTGGILGSTAENIGFTEKSDLIGENSSLTVEKSDLTAGISGLTTINSNLTTGKSALAIVEPASGPALRVVNPDLADKEPVWSSEEPDLTFEPILATENPVSTTEKPVSKFKKPVKAAGNPVFKTRQPVLTSGDKDLAIQSGLTDNLINPEPDLNKFQSRISVLTRGKSLEPNNSASSSAKNSKNYLEVLTVEKRNKKRDKRSKKGQKFNPTISNLVVTSLNLVKTLENPMDLTKSSPRCEKIGANHSKIDEKNVKKSDTKHSKKSKIPVKTSENRVGTIGSANSGLVTPDAMETKSESPEQHGEKRQKQNSMGPSEKVPNQSSVSSLEDSITMETLEDLLETSESDTDSSRTVNITLKPPKKEPLNFNVTETIVLRDKGEVPKDQETNQGNRNSGINFWDILENSSEHENFIDQLENYGEKDSLEAQIINFWSSETSKNLNKVLEEPSSSKRSSGDFSNKILSENDFWGEICNQETPEQSKTPLELNNSEMEIQNVNLEVPGDSRRTSGDFSEISSTGNNSWSEISTNGSLDKSKPPNSESNNSNDFWDQITSTETSGIDVPETNCNVSQTVFESLLNVNKGTSLVLSENPEELDFWNEIGTQGSEKEALESSETDLPNQSGSLLENPDKNIPEKVVSNSQEDSKTPETSLKAETNFWEDLHDTGTDPEPEHFHQETAEKVLKNLESISGPHSDSEGFWGDPNEVSNEKQPLTPIPKNESVEKSTSDDFWSDVLDESSSDEKLDKKSSSENEVQEKGEKIMENSSEVDPNNFSEVEDTFSGSKGTDIDLQEGEVTDEKSAETELETDGDTDSIDFWGEKSCKEKLGSSAEIEGIASSNSSESKEAIGNEESQEMDQESELSSEKANDLSLTSGKAEFPEDTEEDEKSAETELETGSESESESTDFWGNKRSGSVPKPLGEEERSTSTSRETSFDLQHAEEEFQSELDSILEQKLSRSSKTDIPNAFQSSSILPEHTKEVSQVPEENQDQNLDFSGNVLESTDNQYTVPETKEQREDHEGFWNTQNEVKSSEKNSELPQEGLIKDKENLEDFWTDLDTTAPKGDEMFSQENMDQNDDFWNQIRPSSSDVRAPFSNGNNENIVPIERDQLEFDNPEENLTVDEISENQNLSASLEDLSSGKNIEELPNDNENHTELSYSDSEFDFEENLVAKEKEVKENLDQLEPKLKSKEEEPSTTSDSSLSELSAEKSSENVFKSHPDLELTSTKTENNDAESIKKLKKDSENLEKISESEENSKIDIQDTKDDISCLLKQKEDNLNLAPNMWEDKSYEKINNLSKNKNDVFLSESSCDNFDGKIDRNLALKIGNILENLDENEDDFSECSKTESELINDDSYIENSEAGDENSEKRSDSDVKCEKTDNLKVKYENSEIGEIQELKQNGAKIENFENEPEVSQTYLNKKVKKSQEKLFKTESSASETKNNKMKTNLSDDNVFSQNENTSCDSGMSSDITSNFEVNNISNKNILSEVVTNDNIVNKIDNIDNETIFDNENDINFNKRVRRTSHRNSSQLSTDGEPEMCENLNGFLDMCNEQAEARLAARRQARAEAREIRMRELERQQKEQEESADKQYDMIECAQQVRTPRSALGGNRTPITNNIAYLSSRRSSEDSLEDAGTSLRDLRHELKELEEKFRKAMCANAQLDNEKSSQTYQLELLKDRIEELEEELSQLRREHRETCRENDQLKRAAVRLKEELTLFKSELMERDALIAEKGLVIVVIGGDEGSGDAIRKALVSKENAELLESAGEGSLDVRLKKFAEEKRELMDQLSHLRLELEEERSRKKRRTSNVQNASLQNGPSLEYDTLDVVDIQREANKQLADYKFRLQKSDQDIATLQATVARLESQVIRYKSAAEASEKAEDELKVEKRKLQREVKESQSRIEELETSNNHLQRRLDKVKNAKSTLFKESVNQNI